MQLIGNLLTAWALLALPTAAVSGDAGLPNAPALTYLYTAFAVCDTAIYETQGPKGLRAAIPIVGGNFTGPRMNGKLLNLGADWATTDLQTGIFLADTRYKLRTDDGANIFIQTSGLQQANGELHLRLVFETGDRKYYWLNNILAIGVLRLVGLYADGGYTLRIAVWNMGSYYNSTAFLNGTTYVQQARDLKK